MNNWAGKITSIFSSGLRGAFNGIFLEASDLVLLVESHRRTEKNNSHKNPI